MNRKEGYYWVKYSSEWEIGYWRESTSEWRIFNRKHYFEDHELDAINETQILPPNN
jgi:hypothetical protein